MNNLPRLQEHALCTWQMTMIYLWRRDFSPLSCYCSTARMCGMQVCVSELSESWHSTLDLWVEITTPGRSGRKQRKRQQKPRPMGETGGGEKRAGRMEQKPWNEMRCLISMGQVRSYQRSVWSDVEPVKAWTTTICTEHSLYSHT